MQRKQHREPPPPRPLVPDQLYRFEEARPYFGYKATQLDEKIKAGEVPAPFKLSDSGRARGWFGDAILDFHKFLRAKHDKSFKGSFRLWSAKRGRSRG